MITWPFVTQAMEDIFSGKEYVFEVIQSDSLTKLKAPFTGGYTVWFTCKPGNNIRSSLVAVLDDKIGDQRQRSVVATYFAQVQGEVSFFARYGMTFSIHSRIAARTEEPSFLTADTKSPNLQFDGRTPAF